jgi:uncharacterized membrane protein (UPF0127 family)
VFDHPVIRIYKNSQQSVVNSQQLIAPNNFDFSSYKTVSYRLLTDDYRLLLADTPEKWERGLMYVKNKEDIGGLDGMIFIFPDSAVRTFWNKNTFSSLKLYWIDKGSVIGTSEMPSITQTKDISTFSSPSAADTVIEVISQAPQDPGASPSQ